MTRYDFLKKAGFTGGALFTMLASCVKEEDKFINAASIDSKGNVISPVVTNTGKTATNNTTGTSGIVGTSGSSLTATAEQSLFITTDALNKIPKPLLKLDLAESMNSNLLTRNGYKVTSSIVVALSKDGKYIAATVFCSHENLKQIIYSQDEWYCTAHGAIFNLSGVGQNNDARKGLRVYSAATDGKTVVIY